VIPFMVNNGAPPIELSVAPSGGAAGPPTLRVSARQAGAAAIVIRQNSREVGRIDGEQGAIEIAQRSLGRGPTTLQAVSEGPAPAVSRPTAIHIR
jgi:hypothetical protein